MRPATAWVIRSVPVTVTSTCGASPGRGFENALRWSRPRCDEDVDGAQSASTRSTASATASPCGGLRRSPSPTRQTRGPRRPPLRRFGRRVIVKGDAGAFLGEGEPRARRDPVRSGTAHLVAQLEIHALSTWRDLTSVSDEITSCRGRRATARKRTGDPIQALVPRYEGTP